MTTPQQEEWLTVTSRNEEPELCIEDDREPVWLTDAAADLDELHTVPSSMPARTASTSPLPKLPSSRQQSPWILKLWQRSVKCCKESLPKFTLACIVCLIGAALLCLAHAGFTSRQSTIETKHLDKVAHKDREHRQLKDFWETEISKMNSSLDGMRQENLRAQAKNNELEEALSRSDAALSEARHLLGETRAALSTCAEQKPPKCPPNHPPTEAERTELLQEARAVVAAGETARQNERKVWKSHIEGYKQQIEDLHGALLKAKQREAKVEDERKKEREAWQKRILHDSSQKQADAPERKYRRSQHADQKHSSSRHNDRTFDHPRRGMQEKWHRSWPSWHNSFESSFDELPWSLFPTCGGRTSRYF